MKRIITCSDGTWNKPGSTDRGKVVQTNVEKLFQCICDTDGTHRQVKAYDQGVGTGHTWWDRVLGGTTGAGIDKNIKDVYSFICLTYEPGDEIYLFGFSRGAYTARSVAGFIRNCGLLKPQHLNLVEKAYELYRDRNDYSSPDSDMMRTFRDRFSIEQETYLHFIGVWDTVGSLGVPLPWYRIRNRNRYKFHDVTLSSKVRHAYQALAIDDRRKLFAPTLWEKSKTVANDPDPEQVMEQRWFTGSHSNVGGGYCDCGLSDITLHWLMKKAEGAGLCFKDEAALVEGKIEISPNHAGELRNSYTPMYWFWWPQWRAVQPNDSKTNQSIDESVWQRWDSVAEYRPKNLEGLRPPKIHAVIRQAPTVQE